MVRFQIGMPRKTVWFGLDIRPTNLNLIDRNAKVFQTAG